MHLFNCIWQGLLTGIVLSLMLGTVFFSLIRNSILSGYKSGIYIALGVIICDIGFISLALLSANFAVFLKTYQAYVSVLAGAVLIGMGLFMIIRSKPASTEGKLFDAEARNPWYYIFNGFLLNALNPVNFFSWLAISSVLTVEMNYSMNDQVMYFSASLFSIFAMEFAIAYFASRLKQWITPKTIQRINQVSGTVFLIAGLRLFSEITQIWHALHFE